ncbi:TetR/AcrR family transcriptional regulator [Mucilaginibacter gynuensis]|uniref:TetR/AcrR family transcriptional regulator n=1 Tax=Mucilaginibacter gynuensis TaxID=1302236 RepID=A0ABP8GDN5_9SPHI
MTGAEKIIEGSEQLFLNAGFKSVTMDDIAKHLGISKKTIYQFFKNKDELVQAFVQSKLNADHSHLCALMNQSGNMIEELISMTHFAEELFSRVNPIAINELQKHHPDAWALFLKFKTDVLTQTLEQLLAKGIKQGYIRDSIDAKIMARMRMNQIETGFNTTIFPVAEYNVWEVQSQFLQHFNYGICTFKGIEILNNYKQTA